MEKSQKVQLKSQKVDASQVVTGAVISHVFDDNSERPFEFPSKLLNIWSKKMLSVLIRMQVYFLF